MKRQSIIILLSTFCSMLTFPQSFELTVDANFDQPNNIRQHLCKMASNITRNFLKDIKNLEDWEAVREERHQQFLEMLGLQGKPLKGQRAPLNVTKTGSIQKKGYRIEKLYYESLPGLYVPANLYIPDGIKTPVPAILYVSGHAHSQKYNYQAHAKNFAQNGFVCLIIETIQRGEVKGEHLGQESNGWFHWYSRGYNPAGVEVWNGIRGLVLLSAMPEVDINNLGVTGISGGGSQSWYLPVADSRIKAAAAVAGAGSLEGQIVQKTIDDHCDCMMPINTYGIDFTDIGALIAPRPFMIAQPNRDLYYSIEAVHTLYNKIKPIYSFYGKPDNLTMKDATGGHSYGSKEELRPEILSFFLKALKGKNIPPDKLGKIDTSLELSEEELKVYINGVPSDDRTKYIQDSFVDLATAPEIKTVEQLNSYRNEVKAFLKEKTFGAFPDEPGPLDMRLDFISSSKSGNERKDYSFVSEEGWRLKVSMQLGQPTDKDQPLLLVLKNPNEERYESDALVSGLRGKVIIAYFEARGIGDTGWSASQQWHIRRAAAWTGRTIASMRVYDVLRCLEALRSIPGVDTDNISILAQGEMAAIAPYATLLDGNVKTLLLKDPPATQNAPSDPTGKGEAIEMLNCLRVTDLPQVAGLHYPNELLIMGNEPKTYEWTQDLYENLDRPDGYKKVQKASQWLDD
ncbi:hypothetical protein MWU78_10480 [Arenibacter sp. F26102]|uniref:alpha/beta hydrolase family protein n=1 Tax=Arenibacter sp. F26102 TaxID=2926416 RepID=UPI001FF223E7|nr:hypothetical protein [Arenibacter sp. F26102]MCK0146071.1 hypothetical protein [Arenibacter sp. F26102]